MTESGYILHILDEDVASVLIAAQRARAVRKLNQQHGLPSIIKAAAAGVDSIRTVVVADGLRDIQARV